MRTGRKRKPLDPKNEQDQHFVNNIKRLGFLQPITVRTVPGSDKPYEIVFGLRRLAAAKYLGRETIPAQVVELTDEQMRFHLVSENTMRKQMDYPEYIKQMKILLDDLETIYGPDPGRAVGGVARSRTARRNPETRQYAAESRLEPDPEPAKPIVGFAGSEPEPTEETTPLPQSHTTLVREATGRGKSVVKEDVLVAKSLTAEQVAVLQVCETPPTRGEYIQLARIDDEDTKGRAIALVMRGNTVAQAIETATAESKAATKAGPAPFMEEEFSDEDWLLSYCHAVRSQIQDPTHFDRDAILYRRTRPAMSVFRLDAKEFVLKAKAQGGSPFVWSLFNAMYTEHPDNWYVCGGCHGRNGDGPTCDQCRGKGYRLRQRDPVKKR